MKKIYSALIVILLISTSYSNAAYPSVGFTQAGSSGRVSISPDLKGKVKDNRYYAPNDLFSVKCFDQILFGQSVSDEYTDEELSMVVLNSPYQKVVKIEYLIHNEDSLSEIFAVKEKFIGSMEYFFSMALDSLSGDKGFNRKSGIVEQKYISDENHGHLYWGSLKFSDNVYRGYLYKTVGGDVVSIMVQIPSVIVNILEKSNKGSTPNSHLLEHALGTLNSMNFKKKS